MSLSAAIAHFGFGATGVASALVATITVAAALEPVLGFCLGCTMFGWLMRVGIIPEQVCSECANLRLREGFPTAAG